jgi:Domain of unknown function (DUF5655)
MPAWTCPSCRRRFGRAQQSHECEPVLALEEYLASQPAEHRAIYVKALKALSRLGELEIDPVKVGILIKRGFTFCELRPKRDGVELSIKLSRPLQSPRFQRVIHYSARRTAYVLRLKAAKEIDRELLAWLTEAYAEASA